MQNAPTKELVTVKLVNVSVSPGTPEKDVLVNLVQMIALEMVVVDT